MANRRRNRDTDEGECRDILFLVTFIIYKARAVKKHRFTIERGRAG